MKPEKINWKIKAGIIAGSLIVLVIAGMIIFSCTVEKVIQTQLENTWKQNFSVGDVSYSLFSSKLTIQNMTWRNPEGYKSPVPAITVGVASADLNVSALFRHVIHVEDITVQRIRLNVEAQQLPLSVNDMIDSLNEKPGINIWDALNSHSGKTRKKTAKTASKGKTWFLRIDHLAILDVKVDFANRDELPGLVENGTRYMLNEHKEKLPKWMQGETCQKGIAKSLSFVAKKIVDNYLQNGVMIPDYQIAKLGQNETSTVQDVCLEVAKKHTNEIKLQLERYKDQKVAELEMKLEQIIEKFEKKKVQVDAVTDKVNQEIQKPENQKKIKAGKLILKKAKAAYQKWKTNREIRKKKAEKESQVQ